MDESWQAWTCVLGLICRSTLPSRDISWQACEEIEKACWKIDSCYQMVTAKEFEKPAE